MKASILAMLLLLTVVVSTFAAEVGQPSNATGQTFEQKQAHILNLLDERIANLQEGRTCIQASKNEEELKTCQEKQATEMKAKAR